MTASLRVSPNPVAPSKRLDVEGAGFSPSSGVLVTMDGITFVAKVYPANDGTFKFSLPSGVVEASRTVFATVGGMRVASASVVVAFPPPTPPAGPVITRVLASAISDTGATVGWSLSEKATGQVEYGTTSAYGQMSTPETTLYAAHAQKLSGLTPGTLYHFRVRSTNAAGIESVSLDSSFTTLAAAPTPTPTPTPTPPPGGAVPLPPSVIAMALTGVDASGAISNFLAQVANGATVIIPDKYRLDSHVSIVGKSKLTLDFVGTGQLWCRGTGYNENFSALYFKSFSGGNHGCKVRNGHLIGSSPTPGVFVSGKEGQHGILADGGSDYEFDRMLIEGMWGDAVEVNSHADKVAIHDLTVPNIGRNALSVIMGTNVELWNFVFGQMGYMPFDIEPNQPGEDSAFVSIHDGTVDNFTNCFFAADGPSKPNDSDVHDVKLERVTVTGHGVGGPRKANLLTIVDIVATKRRKNFVFRDLTCLVPVTGVQFKMAHVDGLTIASVRDPNGPVQVSYPDCPGAVIAP